MASTHPVLTSKAQGPSRGMLVFANELEEAKLQELGKTVSQPFQLMPLTDRRIPAATRELLLRLPPGKRQLERFSSEQEIEGYSLAADILTGERFAVRMTAARSFTAEGRRVTGYFVWALFGVGALLITTMLLLLNRTVLLPLKSLSGKVSCLDFTQPDTLLTEPDGAELNNLARSINGAMGFLKQARQEAESATRAKSRFLATMTHELRTPLNAILGLSESLLARLRGPLTDEQSAALQSIHGSGEHLLSLINDILDISKIEANKMELFLEEISLQELCEECIGYMTAPAAAKGITLISGSTEAPRLFRADRRRMKQILLNLLDNAVKFTPRGGSVQLEVTGDPAGGGVRFAVRDSGIGIGEAQQQELFHPFTQVDDSLSRRHEGTGLGLALVAQLTALHHGSVTVASRPAEGSCFTVTIPLQAEGTTATCRTPVTNNQSPVAAPASAVTVSRSRLILLAEDNQVAFDMVASYLQGEGYRIIGAGSGDEAVALTERELPALVLMDIRMPGMSGIEAIRRIRELPSPAGEIPLIALTAQASPEERERCLAAGADAFVSKPIRLRQLTEIIGNLLGARSVSEHQ